MKTETLDEQLKRLARELFEATVERMRSVNKLYATFGFEEKTGKAN